MSFALRLIQFGDPREPFVARVVDHETVEVLDVSGGVYALAQAVLASGKNFGEYADAVPARERASYAQLVRERALLPPVTHPDPAHCRVSGTGLTHLGSASSRNAMHVDTGAREPLTDSMRMFRMGVEGGRPSPGGVGAQPEWFYKGDGSVLVAPEQDLPVPPFATDAGEEPEIAGVYLVAPDGSPVRLGFALGNECSDHATEKVNYLWLAHSKLRACSFGPELLVGELPENVSGLSRIVRDGQVVWEKPFVTGEANMSHTIANLEHHHFKYEQFRRPGDLHVHYFGTSTLSVADGFVVEDGDRFEIEAGGLGRPLRNGVRFEHASRPDAAVVVRAL